MRFGGKIETINMQTKVANIIMHIYKNMNPEPKSEMYVKHDFYID